MVIALSLREGASRRRVRQPDVEQEHLVATSEGVEKRRVVAADARHQVGGDVARSSREHRRVARGQRACLKERSPTRGQSQSQTQHHSGHIARHAHDQG